MLMTGAALFVLQQDAVIACQQPAHSDRQQVAVAT